MCCSVHISLQIKKKKKNLTFAKGLHGSTLEVAQRSKGGALM